MKLDQTEYNQCALRILEYHAMIALNKQIHIEWTPKSGFQAPKRFTITNIAFSMSEMQEFKD